MTRNQFYNLLAFLTVTANEYAPEFFMDAGPEYLVDKYLRYVVAPPRDDNAWGYGMHPRLRPVFDAYLARWARELIDLFPAEVEA